MPHHVFSDRGFGNLNAQLEQLYAAMRARYGPGPKTALCAGAAVRCLGYLLAAVGPIALHLFPGHIMAIGLAVGLVEVLVGTVAGAWLYREATA